MIARGTTGLLYHVKLSGDGSAVWTPLDRGCKPGKKSRSRSRAYDRPRGLAGSADRERRVLAHMRRVQNFYRDRRAERAGLRQAVVNAVTIVGWSQRKAADYFGVQPSTVNQWVKRTREWFKREA